MSERQAAEFEEKVLSSELVFRGKVVKLRVDTLKLSNGHTTTREVVVHPDSVCALALTPQRRIILVRQYRRAADRLLWELPAGKMDAGESPEQSLARELSEECGVVSDAITRLATFFVSPGFCTERMHLFLAEECRYEDSHAEEDEILDWKEFTLEEAEAMVERNEIADAKTQMAVLMLRARA